MGEGIRVVLVDDHSRFREAVARALGAEGGIDVVGEGGSADDAVRLAERLSPDLLVLDLHMPGGGINAARALKERCPATRTVVLTVSEEEEEVVAAFDAGVVAYVLKGISARELGRILRAAHHGERYLSPTLAQCMQ